MRLRVLTIIAFLNCAMFSNLVIAESIEGENLIQPIPIPSLGGPWKAFEKVGDDSKQAMWRNKGGYEILETLVQYTDGEGSIEGIKSAGENNYKQACAEYSSETINNDIENGYQSIVWKITCKTNNDFTVTILHKGITGNDALYIIQKIWKTDVTDDSWNTWVNYFNKINVCDTRSTKSLCPSGFRKANDDDDF